MNNLNTNYIDSILDLTLANSSIVFKTYKFLFSNNNNYYNLLYNNLNTKISAI